MAFTQRHSPIPFPRWSLGNRNGKSKVHRYNDSAMSNDFCLEALSDQSGFMMTSCRAGVRRGDWIHIVDTDGCQEYRVDEIDFYSEPADMWIAKLHTAS